MHAAIAAKSYEVRLLTQLVRLPVPSWAQLEGARTYASTFEKVEARQMFRVPFATGTQEGLLQCSHGSSVDELGDVDDADAELGAGGPATARPAHNMEDDLLAGNAGNGDSNPPTNAFSADPWGLERPGDALYYLDSSAKTDPRDLNHIRLVQEAMQYWQSYDAFSRVSMSIGANQLVMALSYYVLGYVLVSNHAVVAAWLAVGLFMAIACALIRLDMSLTGFEYRIAVLLVCTGPICASISARVWAATGPGMPITILMPIAFLSHTCWLVYILYLCKVDKQNNGVHLPTGFRSVLYIDVFGWIKDNPFSQMFRGSQQALEQSGPRIPSGESAAGPGVQSVRYVDGRPVPMRVEQLPGAARLPKTTDLGDPESFVPQLKQESRTEEEDGPDIMSKAQNAAGSGSRPWYVFCGATSLLAILWWILGVLVTSEIMGVTYLKVAPLTRGSEEIVEKGDAKKSLLAGEALLTKWPHENVHTLGLACNGASNMAVASSRFGLYLADLSPSTSKSFIQFNAAPLCEDIEGESLQDVALQCGGAADCQAVVLHQQGRQLAKCALTKRTATKDKHAPSMALIAEDWLNDADTSSSLPPEKVQSLAFLSDCSGERNTCAYVGTTGERVVEMRQAGAGVKSGKYVPHRLLHTKLDAAPSGSMDVIHGRYLALLQQDGKHVKVIDLQNGGTLVDSWRIPSINQTTSWSAMCASNNNLFLLSRGQSPQLWRFDVPKDLRQSPSSQSASRDASATKSKVLLQASTSRRKQQLLQENLNVESNT
jgi:hypothetical protein